MTTVNFDVISQRKATRTLYLAKLTLTGTAGTKTLYLSDHYAVYGGLMFRGFVSEWETIEWGLGKLGDDRYAIPDVQLTLSVQRYGGVETDDFTVPSWKDLLDVFRIYPPTGATLEIFLSYKDLPDPWASAQRRFYGRVYDAPEFTPDSITLRATSDVYTDIVASYIPSKKDNADLRESDILQSAPVVGGVIGWDRDTQFLFERDGLGWDDTSAIVSDATSWPRAGLHRGAVPACRLIDSVADAGADMMIKVASGAISSNALPGGGRILAEWPGIDDQLVSLFRVEAGDYNTANATVTLATEVDAADEVKDGDIAIGIAYIPKPDPNKYITDGYWTNAQNAFDRTNLGLYAEALAGNSIYALGVEGYDFVDIPDGDQRNLIPRVTDLTGDLHYMFALIQCQGPGGLSNVDLVMTWNGGNDTYNFTNLADGYHWLWNKWGSAARSAWITGPWGDDSTNDKFYIQCPDNLSDLRVYLMGFYIVWCPRQQPLFETSNPVRFYFAGYGNQTSLVDNSPGDVLKRIMADHSDGAIHFTNSFSAGFVGFKTDINNSVSINNPGFPIAQAACSWSDIVTLEDIINDVQKAFFCRVWHDPRSNKYDIYLKISDPDADGYVMRPRDILTDNEGKPLVQISYMTDDEVYTSILLEYDYDHHKSRFHRRCLIDSDNSENSVGESDATFEAASATAEAIFGRRRQLLLQTKLINDPATAWDVVVRRFRMQGYRRPILTVRLDYAALDLDLGAVFETDNEMDAFMNFPGPSYGLNLTSWNGRKWQVARIRELPYEGFEVMAYCVDRLPAT